MTDRAALLEALLVDPSLAATVSREEARGLLIEMARVERALELALTTPALIATEPCKSETVPRLLTVQEAAERSRKSVRWIRDHWRMEMPFAVRKGRTLLFPEAEFERWMKRT